MCRQNSKENSKMFLVGHSLFATSPGNGTRLQNSKEKKKIEDMYGYKVSAVVDEQIFQNNSKENSKLYICPLGAHACTSHYSKDNGKGAGVPRRVVPYARISFLEGGERGGWGCLISVFYSSHSLKGGGYLATANSGSVAGSQVE